jgi:glycosyltransferase involved in cell wall biosynthesis
MNESLGRPPLVSVIMPAFNASRFIDEAIASVLGQTLSDLELLVVDDGSTDGTLQVMRSCADPRLRILTQVNRGPSAARNLSLLHMRASQYVAFLDADDRWDPEKLTRQTAYMEADPTCAVVGCLMRYVSSTGRALGVSGELLDDHLQALVSRGEHFPFPLSSFLVRRRAIERTGGFDESLRGAEDMDLLARLCQVGTVICLPEVLGAYRIHPESAMARDQLKIKRAARFVKRRLAARREGKDLSWDAFVASDRERWSDRRENCVELCYRRAALWYGERRYGKALVHWLAAAVLNPVYAVGRLRLQRRQTVGDPSKRRTVN